MLKKLHDIFIPHRRNGGHPHLLHHGTMLGTAVIAVFVLAGLASLTDSRSFTRLSANVYSSILIDLTNANRKESNTPLLIKSDRLTYAAEMKVEDMARKEYFAHQTPEGYTSWYWFARAGYPFAYAGENLAIDFTESADVDRAWMNSPTHRANIIDARFTEIGIATEEGRLDGRETTYVAQMFGTPAGMAIAPEPSTASTSPSLTATASIDITQSPSVLGAIKVVSETRDETSSMIIVKNEAVREESADTATQIVPAYTAPSQKFLIEFSKPLGLTLVTLGLLFAIAFLLSLHYHKRITARIALGALCACIILATGYSYLSIAEEVAPLGEVQ